MSRYVCLALLLVTSIPGQPAWAEEQTPLPDPRVGEYVVVHHLTWMYRSPSKDSEKWADNATRALNQTDYLVFRVAEVADDWVRVQSYHPYRGGSGIPTCYRTLDGMADLGLTLWVPRDQLQQVTRDSLALPQEDGTRATVTPGVVVLPPEDGRDGAVLHEYGLRVPVQLDRRAVGTSYTPQKLPPRDDGLALVLAPDTAVRFGGSPVDLTGAVAMLSLTHTGEDAVEIATTCGDYRFLRERPEVPTSSPPPAGDSPSSLGSLEGVGMLMLTGGEGGEGSIGDLFGVAEEIALPPMLVLPAGSALTWPDGTPASTLSRDVTRLGQSPESEGDGRTCYRLTLGTFPCEACADNVILCVPSPAP